MKNQTRAMIYITGTKYSVKEDIESFLYKVIIRFSYLQVVLEEKYCPKNESITVKQILTEHTPVDRPAIERALRCLNLRNYLKEFSQEYPKDYINYVGTPKNKLYINFERNSIQVYSKPKMVKYTPPRVENSNEPESDQTRYKSIIKLLTYKVLCDHSYEELNFDYTRFNDLLPNETMDMVKTMIQAASERRGNILLKVLTKYRIAPENVELTMTIKNSIEKAVCGKIKGKRISNELIRSEIFKLLDIRIKRFKRRPIPEPLFNELCKFPSIQLAKENSIWKTRSYCCSRNSKQEEYSNGTNVIEICGSSLSVDRMYSMLKKMTNYGKTGTQKKQDQNQYVPSIFSRYRENGTIDVESYR